MSLLLAALLVGCSTPRGHAPVEDRGAASRPAPRASDAAPPTAAAAPGAATEPAKPPPGAENAGKPGYYTVKRGDSLIRIGLDFGQNWRDLVRWNNIENPNLIEVGQVIRVVPPNVDAAAVTARGVATTKVESRPLDTKPGAAAAPSATPASGVAPTAPAAAAAPASAVAVAPPAAPAPASTPPAAPREADEELTWAWPANGTVAGSFEEGRSRGLQITGKAGDPVLAAADGRVIYAGSALRGYGNLIILKHNATYLTAYAHNRALLVKEDQAVRRGQPIAEMGASDADRVQLHFEIRRQGKPIDPLRLLPAR